MTELTITAICRMLETQGDERLERSSTSLLQHALQTAWCAERAAASPSLVCACFLHDLGHVLANESEPGHDSSASHDALAAEGLRGLFDVSVTDPIRLHVHAKRYLCYTHADYARSLSSGAKRSLERQGGALSPAEARAFMLEPYALDAVNLRLWDDRAHQPGVETPSLAHYAAMLRTCVLPKHSATRTASGR